MATTDPIFELRGVCKYFDDTCALSNIDLAIRNGEFLTLLGPSGCGKTTILRILSGFETPSTGEVRLNDTVINDVPPEKRKVNTVFQNYALFPHMTVRDNVGFGLAMAGTEKGEMARRVREALTMVHMEHLADRRPGQLSGGQQQRVGIARAVVNNPLVLLLDEPFSALDFKLRKAMQLEIKQLQRSLGITFVFVTHDQEEAFAMSDRVVVMNEGQIVQVGTPKEIYEEPASLYVARFVGDINILDATVRNATGDGMYRAEVEGVTMALHSKRRFSDGTEVKVLLRPEDLRVHRVAEGMLDEPHLLGRIAQTVYKGATVDLYVQLDDAHGGKTVMASEFFNEDDEEIIYDAGERVAVTWVDGWEVVLHAEDQ